MRKVSFIYFLMFFCLDFCMAQSRIKSYDENFENLINKIILDNYRPFSLISDMQAKHCPDSLMPLLKKYENFPNTNVQNSIYASYYEYGMEYGNSVFKSQMINHLLNACSNIDSVELSYTCIQSAVYLMDFDNSLFNKSMVETINQRASESNRIYLYYAKLSGKLYQKEMIPVFENKLNNAKHSEEKYILNQVLARLGRKQSVFVIRDSLKKMNVEDRLWQDNIFMYVRQKPVIDLLFNDLLSDEKGTFYFESWMKTPIEKLCAYDALKLLTKIILDFPVKEKDNFTDEDLKTARQWVKKHKNNYKIKK